MRYLAIDFGSKRTGLAICDPSETFVSPYKVVHGQKGLIEKIENIIHSENIEAVVVGLPLNMDDTEGPQAELVFEFAEKLKDKINLPVHLQDERLTSYSAEEKLKPADMTVGKQKKRIDAVAAAEILNAFLDKNKN